MIPNSIFDLVNVDTERLTLIVKIEQEKTKQITEQEKTEQEKTRLAIEQEKTKQITEQEKTKRLQITHQTSKIIPSTSYVEYYNHIKSTIIEVETPSWITPVHKICQNVYVNLPDEDTIQKQFMTMLRKLCKGGHTSLKAIDTHNNTVIGFNKPDITLIPRSFIIEDLSNICSNDGLCYLSQCFIEIKTKIENNNGAIGQVFSYLHKAHERDKYRNTFIGAVSDYRTIRFVRSTYSSATGMKNEITKSMPLFDPDVNDDNYTSVGINYLYSLLRSGVGNNSDSVVAPDEQVILKRLLGKGCTSFVYEVTTNECQIGAMKLSNSQRHCDLIHHEEQVLEKIQDLSNTPQILDYEERKCIFFPIYKPLENYTLSTSNIISLIDLLKKIHSRNIYHRDIRPENLLLDDSNKVILTDWGFSLIDQSSNYMFAGTASFCAKQYAQSWLDDDWGTIYHPKYDCESLLKCLYYLLNFEIRLNLIEIAHEDQKMRLKLAIDIWENVNDLNFIECLKKIRSENENMYHALEEYVRKTSNVMMDE